MALKNQGDIEVTGGQVKQDNVPLLKSQGTQYIYVQADGTDTENATELQNAYDTAKTMSPSATNRITVVAGIGNYNFSSDFVMNTQYIDLVSLDGNRSVVFNGTRTINITANGVFVKGVDVVDKKFTIADNLNLLKVENCKGGDYSFGEDSSFAPNPINVSGTFIDCEGGLGSFGGFGTASGTFINCQSGSNSFGRTNNSSGIFKNCTAVNQSFGYLSDATGTYEYCTANNRSFGCEGNATGTFKYCTAGNQSFGYRFTTNTPNRGDATGIFIGCEASEESFGHNANASGTFINCIGTGEENFAAFGIASGVFTNCIGAGDECFGKAGDASGTFTNCIGGFTSFGQGGDATGTFTNCVGGEFSWAWFGADVIEGKLYNCRLTTGTFRPVTGSGVLRNCIDGNDAIRNDG